MRDKRGVFTGDWGDFVLALLVLAILFVTLHGLFYMGNVGKNEAVSRDMRAVNAGYALSVFLNTPMPDDLPERMDALDEKKVAGLLRDRQEIYKGRSYAEFINNILFVVSDEGDRQQTFEAVTKAVLDGRQEGYGRLPVLVVEYYLDGGATPSTAVRHGALAVDKEVTKALIPLSSGGYAVVRHEVPTRQALLLVEGKT